tara:strand:+ start:63 stop:653 length:591 start_codon:yes stop_codon:yes gene_type:complete
MVTKDWIKVGKYTYGFKQKNVLFDNPSYTKDNKRFQPKLNIGNFCSIGGGVIFYLGGNHRHDWITSFPFHVTKMHNRFKSLGVNENEYNGYPQSNGNIDIGSDVWIGDQVTILSGVKIGDGAVISCNSVVSKDVEPYSIVGGNPSRHIKYRFDYKTRNKLLNLKWWDMDDNIIDSLLPFMYSNDIDKFLHESKKWL